MSPSLKSRFRRAKLALVAIYAGLLLTTANVVADYSGLKYLHPGNKRWYLNAYAQQQTTGSPDLVILGTSMARFGINATRLAETLDSEGRGKLETFNLAQPAAGPVRNAALLRDLVTRCGCPSIVVVEVSSYGLRPEGDWWRLLGDYATLRDLPVLARDLTALERADGYLSASTRGFERFHDFLFRRPDAEVIEREVARRGSQYSDRPWKFPRLERQRPLAPAVDPPPQTDDQPGPIFELRDAPRRGLVSLIDSARACEALIVMVQMPTAIALSREFTTRFERQFRSEIVSFAESREILFLDYNRIDLGLGTPQFRDWRHLNYEGAEVLSGHLARQVIAPWLAAQR